MQAARYAFFLAGWACIGLTVTTLGGITSDSVAWWLLMGLPGALIATSLALGFAVAVVGLYLGLLTGSR